MDITPAISRSGRVLKKSSKLLDMETETIGKTGRQSGTKPGKISIINSNDSLILSEQNVEQQQQPIRLKFNLSNCQQTLPNITVLANESINSNSCINKIGDNSTCNLNGNPVIVSTTTAPIQIRTTSANILPPRPSPTIGSLIVKVNNDSNDSIKRIDQDSINSSIVKRIKINDGQELTSLKTVSSTPLVRIITNSNTQQFKSNYSPIVAKPSAVISNNNEISCTQRSIAPRMAPLMNTSSLIPPNRVLPLSIQEQRRINQANRARLQLHNQKLFKEELRNKQMSIINKTENNDDICSNTNNNGHGGKSHKKTISPYVLWCKENRNHIQSNYPELDFSNLSKKMGGIWHTLPKSEKEKWTRKAQLMSKYGTGFNMDALYDYDDEDLKPDIVLDNLTLPIIKTLDKTFGDNFINTDTSSIDGEKHHIGVDLIDIQAYLSILGDSLMTISTYIQRGIKYNSQIEYCSTAACSTLLDTALVSMSTLASITLSLPRLSVDRKRVKKCIENATYFMPPSEF